MGAFLYTEAGLKPIEGLGGVKPSEFEQLKGDLTSRDGLRRGRSNVSFFDAASPVGDWDSAEWRNVDKVAADNIPNMTQGQTKYVVGGATGIVYCIFLWKWSEQYYGGMVHAYYGSPAFFQYINGTYSTWQMMGLFSDKSF